MTEFQIQSATEEETMKLAETLTQYLNPGDVITLEGDLGAGKTTFTKGIAKGLGVKQIVNSPTFTIIKEYEGDLPFYHMDVYRLEDMDEDIGFDEYFDGKGITVVEWAHFIQDYLPEELLNITISYKDEHSRVLVFHPVGQYFTSIVSKLLEI
ncbi:tRNA (adenosine(37)-N6)-threonylcarbamoyltransferase complex ATPase subunit type 1 TsaE [Virgibacillus soli]|uniref:tRNA threonylcarbamoyladenosine biosynthesis protein TsaE n=1 Tax=Paracerasibacillus soli TaxID=480284 RepID=A0ABU5CVU1_9BACI|nr:tRNA (adenosine(37)-N6)-threonylcarbamoyltransferase complex ATPase subunit type 1 TsaE [Virgibacillus soli]MDY0410482.1 tRNA (adenosine(37)-N6)-threonylcarbamoyltransferase complex ATPase subunit type 1 TsaE [Virgibacillus soli]